MSTDIFIIDNKIMLKTVKLNKNQGFLSLHKDNKKIKFDKLKIIELY